MNSNSPTEQQPWAVLRQFVRPRPPVERCELCGLGLVAEHSHLLDASSRQLLCCCDACSILFSSQQHARYQRVPPRVERLVGFRLSDSEWDELHLPINLAFFVRSQSAGRVLAYFPSPAGATESLLTLDAWERIARVNPVLQSLEPDVEAWLANRLGGADEHYRVSIDECFRLVGLIRTHWRGLSGGTEVGKEIASFFARLNERARPSGGRGEFHA